MSILTPYEAVRIAGSIYEIKTASADADGRISLASIGVTEEPANRFAGLQLDPLNLARFGFELEGMYGGTTGYGKGRQTTGFMALAKGDPAIASTVDNVKRSPGEALISIRGTNLVSSSDWNTNINIFEADFNGEKVHKGFYDTFKSLESHVSKFIQTQRPGVVHCVGHSLGGALATLVALHIRETLPGATVKLYTFGSPRVGRSSFSRYATKKLESGANAVYRVYHDADVVSMVPTYPYYHIPSVSEAYALNWSGSLISVYAHLTSSYENTIQKAEWGALKSARSTPDQLSKLELFLTSAVGGAAIAFAPTFVGSAVLLGMIGKAIHFLYNKLAPYVGSSEAPRYFTGVDTVAWMLHVALYKAPVKIGMMVRGLLVRIAQFLGIAVGILGDLKDIAVSIIRWLLNKLYSVIANMLSRSIEMLTDMPTLMARREFNIINDSTQLTLVGNATSRSNGPFVQGSMSRHPQGVA